MGERHIAREWVVQFLFQREFNRGEIDKDLKEFWEAHEVTGNIQGFAERLIWGVEEHREGLDRTLQQYAENWDVARMSAVDRNILRLAIYELQSRPDIPPVVSVNEAVDLARRFSSDPSPAFVNGILDAVARGVRECAP